jgi:hypothetical protein
MQQNSYILPRINIADLDEQEKQQKKEKEQEKE